MADNDQATSTIERCGVGEFQRRLFAQGTPLSGTVFSEYSGENDDERLNGAALHFFCWMGPGGIGQYSLKNPGKIHLIGQAKIIHGPYEDPYFDSVFELSGGSTRLASRPALEHLTHIGSGNLQEDIEKAMAKSLEGDDDSFTDGTFILTAEGGKLGMHQSEGRLTEIPKILPAGKVERNANRLFYHTASGKNRDYSHCIIE